MSGIIGGAGSRSGVVGTTELDYEDGTWTPAMTAESTSTQAFGRYTRIGDIVWIMGEVNTIGNQSGGSTVGITGFPFTCKDVQAGFSTISLHRVDWPASVKSFVVKMTLNSTNAIIGWTIDQLGVLNCKGTDFADNASQCAFSGVYRI